MRKNKWTILLATLALGATFIGLGACGEETPVTPTPAPTPTPGNSATDFIFPADASPIVWSEPTYGDGSAFGGRYACKEGYYEVQLPAGTEMFYEFSVESTGLYALYTTSVVEGITITQYDASIQYIPTDEDGNFIGNEAVEVPVGNGDKAGVLYSKINCPQKYYNENWRATYGFISESAQTIKVRFVRIGDELHVPENIITTVQTEEVEGKFYLDPNVETPVNDIAPVPFSVKYFYDEDYEIQVTPFSGGEPVTVKGFYRIGTKEKPGEVIYAMLTDIPVRMFDTSFVELLNKGTSLRLQSGVADNGDYLIDDYIDFIMSNGNNTKACYQNAVNDKGLYPVNQELYKFLNAYVSARGCAGMTEAEQKAYPDAMWLAPCYFYGDMSNGTEQYPFALNYGDNQITLQKQSYVFYNVRWEKTTNESTGKDVNQGFVTLSCDNPSVVLKFVNDDTHKNYSAPFEISVETDILSGATVMLLYTGNEAEAQINVRVSETQGVDTNPIAITEDSVKLTLKKHIYMDGTVEYFAVYEKRFEQAGVVSIDYARQNVQFTVNGETPSGVIYLDVIPSDVITIVVSADENYDETTSYLELVFGFTPTANE